MGVIHDPPYRPTKGKFRIIRAIPENIGSCMLQMSVAKMTGQRARRSTIAGVGLVAKSSENVSGLSVQAQRNHMAGLSAMR